MLDIGSNTRNQKTRGNIIKFQLPQRPPEAALAPTDSVPLAGLGLPFVGPEAHSPDDRTAAIQTITHKPAVDIGLDFPVLPGGGTLVMEHRFLSKWHAHASWGPYRNWHRSHTDYAPVLDLLPQIVFPSSQDIWVAAEHVRALFAQRSVVAVDEADLPAWHLDDEIQGHAQPEPRRWRRPPCRGDVTYDDVQRFFGAFPALVKATTCLLGWNSRSTKSTAPAESANRVAERVLGFSVDLRFGALVAHDDYMRTLIEACGETTVDGRKTTFAACVTKRLQRHGRLVWVPTLEDAGNKLRGAAWSADVNRWVNAPETWWRG